MADSYRTRGSDGRLFKEHDNSDGTYSDAVHIQSATAGINVDLDMEADDLGVKAEDAIHASGAMGNYVLAVSAATPTATAGAAGDYQGLSVSSTTGNLFVKATDSDALLTTIDADTSNIASDAASVKTAVEIMDDWDESDRAKVNPIAGQAGIAAGAGAVDALTPRVILASDDPAVTKLGTIDTDTGNIATYTTDIPNVLGTDGNAGPSKALSVAGTQATGELQELQVDADGQLQVDVVSTALPTGAATEATLLLVESAVDGLEASATSIDGKITACNTGAIVGTVTANAGTNLNTSALALEAGGNLATIAGDTTSLDGKVTTCNTGAVTIAASALPSGAATEATLGTIDTDTGNIVTNTTDIPNVIGTSGGAGPAKAVSVAGTTAAGNLEEILADDDGHLQIDVLSCASHAVTNAGTFAVQVDGSALTALQLIDDAIYTEAATDSTIAGIPILWEDASDTLRAVSAAKPLPVVALETRTRVSKTVDITASQTAADIWDPTGGTKFVITHMHGSFSVGGNISIFDETDASGSIVLEGTYAADGGFDIDFAAMHFQSATADNILEYTTGAGITGHLTVHGYEV